MSKRKDRRVLLVVVHVDELEELKMLINSVASAYIELVMEDVVD